MRNGISWRNRCRQAECLHEPNQSWTWMQSLVGRKARSGRRAALVLVLFLISCFLTWTLSRFRTPPSISTESLLRRAVVLELFRYSQARNRSFTDLALVHRRRRWSLVGTRSSTPHEIFDEEEQEEQLFDGLGDELPREFNSVKKRTGCHESMTCPKEASLSVRAAKREKKFRVVGGCRKTDRELQPLLAQVPIGYSGRLRSYQLVLDTGSGITWVNCEGSRQVGTSGHFHPAIDCFVNCEIDKSLCKTFQDGLKHPCNERRKFRCLFGLEYVDGSTFRGCIIKANVRFDLPNPRRGLICMALGCADEGKAGGPEVEETDEDAGSSDEDELTSCGPSDGVLGLGRHPASWLRQLHMKGHISEYVVVVCLEPAKRVRTRRSSTFERAGFISFGGLYTTQAAGPILYTSVVRPEIGSNEGSWTTLMEVKYRDKRIGLRPRGRNQGGKSVMQGMEMEFDTGTSLTYLDSEIFDAIVSLDSSGSGCSKNGIQRTQDEPDPGATQRPCWWNKNDRRESIVSKFGDLIMKFSSLADDGSTSNLIIKPEYYIVTAGYVSKKSCFNMRKLLDRLDRSLLGGEAMRGHLLIFSQQPVEKIGWRPVTSCNSVR